MIDYNKKYETMFDYLAKKYNKSCLSKREVCTELNMKESTFNKKIAENNLNEIPQFKKGRGEKSIYQFPITSLAQFLVQD